MTGTYRHSRQDRQCHALPPTYNRLHDRYNQPYNDDRGSTPCLSFLRRRCRRFRLRLWTHRSQDRSSLTLTLLAGLDAVTVLHSTPESSLERCWTHMSRKLRDIDTMQQRLRIRRQVCVVDS